MTSLIGLCESFHILNCSTRWTIGFIEFAIMAQQSDYDCGNLNLLTGKNFLYSNQTSFQNCSVWYMIVLKVTLGNVSARCVVSFNRKCNAPCKKGSNFFQPSVIFTPHNTCAIWNGEKCHGSKILAKLKAVGKLTVTNSLQFSQEFDVKEMYQHLKNQSALVLVALKMFHFHRVRVLTRCRFKNALVRVLFSRFTVSKCAGKSCAVFAYP